MTDDELTNALSRALTLSESDRAHLTADFARRKAEDDARLWRVVFRAIKDSQEQLDATLKCSRAARRAAQTLLSKG
ncbi:MAG: hypothetical protein QM758_26975 [Armatimonas sp.]